MTMTEETEQAPAPKLGIDQRIQQYVMLRDKIKEEDEAHKQKMKPYRETLDKLNSLLLDLLNNSGGDSIKTKFGTAYKTVKRSASLEDPEKFMEFVIEKEAWDLIERKVSVTAAEAFADENGILPPGVKMSSQATVGVRRPA